MKPCIEEMTLCASSESEGEVNANSSYYYSTIYTGSCQGLVKNHPDRWCYFKSLELNLCCGNAPSDCCVVAPGKVFMTTLGSSVLISVFVFIFPILLMWSWKRLQTSYANYKAFHRQVAPPAIVTVPPQRSNYVPKSTAALAVMKQVPIPVTVQEVSSTWVQSLANPPAANLRRISSNGKSIYDESELSEGPPPSTRVCRCLPAQSSSDQPTPSVPPAADIESTLTDPSASAEDESKAEIQ
jgi:hypothetical protein